MSTILKNGHNKKLLIDIQPNIGLDTETRLAIIELLNIILADEAVLAIKTRTAYWNLGGADYFELHTLYENQFQNLTQVSDDIAERIRIVGGFAIGSLSEFIQSSRIEGQPGIVPDILLLLADQEAFTRYLREDARKCSEEFVDEGTFELLVSILRLHEKMAWMLRSLIEPELSTIEPRGG